MILRVVFLYLHKWMVKAPHCTEEAWKFPLSTCRYLVLTVCERNLLNKATFVPLATQTARVIRKSLVQIFLYIKYINIVIIRPLKYSAQHLVFFFQKLKLFLLQSLFFKSYSLVYNCKNNNNYLLSINDIKVGQGGR